MHDRRLIHQPMGKTAFVFLVLVFMGLVPEVLILPCCLGIVALDLILPWRFEDD